MDSGDLGAGVQNYRAFRYNWTGIPSEVPAIAAFRNRETTTIYVSWNGDTETVAWRFFAVTDELGSRQFLGEVARTSFETSLEVQWPKLNGVAAEAVDARGRVLVNTASVKIEQEILPPRTQSETKSTKDQKVLGEASNWEEHAILKVMRLKSGDDL